MPKCIQDHRTWSKEGTLYGACSEPQNTPKHDHVNQTLQPMWIFHDRKVWAKVEKVFASRKHIEIIHCLLVIALSLFGLVNCKPCHILLKYIRTFRRVHTARPHTLTVVPWWFPVLNVLNLGFWKKLRILVIKNLIYVREDENLRKYSINDNKSKRLNQLLNFELPKLPWGFKYSSFPYKTQ